jgi:diguanylate cyclase (GGDEF)-like protein
MLGAPPGALLAGHTRWGSVFATGFWSPLAAPILNGIALLLALGFRRNRAVLVAAVLICASLAVAGIVGNAAADRGSDAVRMFAPWLLLAAALTPERRLLARRNLVLLFALLVAVWLTLAAPAHVWPGLLAALPLGVLPWGPGAIAATITFVAAGLCLLRWILSGAIMEAGLGIVLVCAGCAMLPAVPLDGTRIALALAGAASMFAVLFASYRMAFVDALSSLPNRRALDEFLARLSGTFAVAMIDIDHFKQFNDTHGHAAGDRVLHAVAQQIRHANGGRAFRYGGEEFCLLFTGSRVRDAEKSCEEARAHIEVTRVSIRSAPKRKRQGQAVRKIDATDVHVTVSIGIAVRDAHSRAVSDVLKAADQALYRAKAKGRNRVVVAK